MIVTPESLKKGACQKEISAVLAKYQMRLDPFMHVTAAGMAIGLNLVPQSEKVGLVPIQGGKADA
jgi:hypothetical protein